MIRTLSSIAAFIVAFLVVRFVVDAVRSGPDWDSPATAAQVFGVAEERGGDILEGVQAAGGSVESIASRLRPYSVQQQAAIGAWAPAVYLPDPTFARLLQIRGNGYEDGWLTCATMRAEDPANAGKTLPSAAPAGLFRAIGQAVAMWVEGQRPVYDGEPTDAQIDAYFALLEETDEADLIQGWADIAETQSFTLPPVQMCDFIANLYQHAVRYGSTDLGGRSVLGVVRWFEVEGAREMGLPEAVW